MTISKLVWPFPDLPSNKITEDKVEEDLYLIEVECGGADAAGGGCGGPIALYKVSKEIFESTPGKSRWSLSCFNEDEHHFDEDKILGVKLQYRPCSCCRRMT